MNLKLKGKVAIIGGSSKGLGRGCAESLAKEGVNVIICSNDKESLDESVEYLRKFKEENN